MDETQPEKTPGTKKSLKEAAAQQSERERRESGGRRQQKVLVNRQFEAG